MTPKDKQISNRDLIQYRISLLEQGQLKHEDRIRLIEDFVTREGATGVPMKTVWLIAGVVATIIGAVLAAILKVAGVS